MIFLRFSFPGIDNVRCGFGTRIGGVSTGHYQSGNISFEVGDSRQNILANRKLFKKHAGFQRLIELKQVHGNQIHFDLKGDFSAGAGAEGDGAGESSPEAAVLIKTADCQPVFLAHESGRYVCGLHVGWRGNRNSFPGVGVERFCKYYRIKPEEVQAVRGPSLGPCCAEFDSFEEHWSADFSRYYHEGRRTMDLWSLTRDQLSEAGVLQKNIFCVDLCTKCQTDMFFSYRRNRLCGRQGSFIFMRAVAATGR